MKKKYVNFANVYGSWMNRWMHDGSSPPQKHIDEFENCLFIGLPKCLSEKDVEKKLAWFGGCARIIFNPKGISLPHPTIHDWISEGNDKFYLAVQGWIFQIDFCPFCGKKLTKSHIRFAKMKKSS